jgi:hypothetical protein
MEWGAGPEMARALIAAKPWADLWKPHVDLLFDLFLSADSSNHTVPPAVS